MKQLDLYLVHRTTALTSLRSSLIYIVQHSIIQYSIAVFNLYLLVSKPAWKPVFRIYQKRPPITIPCSMPWFYLCIVQQGWCGKRRHGNSKGRYGFIVIFTKVCLYVEQEVKLPKSKAFFLRDKVAKDFTRFARVFRSRVSFACFVRVFRSRVSLVCFARVKSLVVFIT